MPPVTLRPGEPGDAGWLAELRAVVLRADLERLGRFDPVRVRQRFRSGFVPAHTRIVLVDGVDAGSVAVRPETGARWIEHFYLAPALQGRGIGGEVLRGVLRDVDPRPFRLNVLQGSRARVLYDRHGFVVTAEDEIDVFMERPAADTGDGSPLRGE
ncbi:GNAT family N-acetyltransferase [Pseudonocardia sp. HH130630-07]|uniref:GNAT family N-acetyltransferase n=1 Tax=Pseudonocardia sp. HH130630-07 TaxID=1690815 RepID=UPI000814E741|nr:GNAT family N-acetyltransferase [Pseudonocardia sp. HH130630-07]ANY05573.1 acetyltransferase [Pseudonocardia sp. HH130630-07]